MAGVVKSVETFGVAVSASNGSFASPITDTLTGGQDIANCVPFVTKRVTGGSTYEHENTQVNVWFTSTDTLNVGRDFLDDDLEVEVSVVEFDDTLCNIYSDAFNLGGTTTDNRYAIGATVDTSKSFLVFHSLQNSSGGVQYSSHLLRGRITDSAGDPGGTHVAIDRTNAAGTADGHWYVVECIGSEFSVETLDIAVTGTSNTGAVTVDKDVTLLLGSYLTTASGDVFNERYTADTTLDSDTVVTVQRYAAVGTHTWSGFAVEFADGTTVQHGTIAAQGATALQDVTLTTPVSLTRSTAVISGNMGSTVTGSFPGTEASDIFDPQVQLTLQDSDVGGDFDELRVQHSISGGAADNDISWCVVDWGENGTPPATRRVMVSG